MLTESLLTHLLTQYKTHTVILILFRTHSLTRSVEFRTTVVIAGDDYAIAAGCTRMSSGYEILSRDQKKLFEL